MVVKMTKIEFRKMVDEAHSNALKMAKRPNTKEGHFINAMQILFLKSVYDEIELDLEMAMEHFNKYTEVSLNLFGMKKFSRFG